jgi:hypothetical protein
VFVDGEAVTAAAVPDEIAEAMGMDDDFPSADPARLVEVLGRGNAATAAQVLASEAIFVSDLHADLATALGLPAWAAAHGWGYMDAGESVIPVEVVRTP